MLEAQAVSPDPTRRRTSKKVERDGNKKGAWLHTKAAHLPTLPALPSGSSACQSPTACGARRCGRRVRRTSSSSSTREKPQSSVRVCRVTNISDMDKPENKNKKYCLSDGCLLINLNNDNKQQQQNQVTIISP